ncbi:MAG TPA: tripartite tricarboxylate transporter substrate-binding protein [Candidatus Binatia bacterium]
MAKKTIRLPLQAIVLTLPLLVGYPAKSSAEDFYQGKTISIIVGYAAGGGYDIYARTVARHLGNHIPGNPTVIVQNMTGAGSLIAANYLYKKAEPDGLTIGSFGGGLVTEQALGLKGIQFDAQKLEWIGSVRTGTPICAVMAFTGDKNLEDVLHSKKELRMGSTGPGSTTDDLPKLMIGLMHAPFKVIRGYKGTSELRVAMQRRELDGACWTWESMRTTARAMLNAKGDDRLIPFVIQGKWEEPEVRDLPQFSDVIKGKENLEAFTAWLNAYKYFQPLSVPPGTPEARVEILRTALKETLEDPAFKADAEKSNLIVASLSGEEIQKLVNQTLSISPEAKKLLESLIGRGKGQV